VYFNGTGKPGCIVEGLGLFDPTAQVSRDVLISVLFDSAFSRHVLSVVSFDMVASSKASVYSIRPRR
jgi:hypothetical protein